MKKLLRYKLICITFLLLTTSIANATISLGFGAPIQSGDSVNIDVLISGLGVGVAPSISTYDLDILFDSNHLSFSSATFGDSALGNQLDLLNFGSNLSDASLVGIAVVNIYEVSFDLASDLNDFQADSFTLATLTFDVLTFDSNQLSFVVNDLGDADANLLLANLTTATVTTVPVPSALWLLASGLAFLYKRQ
jgi:hypothetical protein